MSPELLQFVDQIKADFPPFFLVFLRVGATMALLPAFGEQSVPQRVRLAITVVFTAIVAPGVVDFFPDGDIQLSAFLTLGATEILSGLLLGIGLRLFVIALQTAGAIAAQSTSLSQIFGTAGVDPMPAIGHVLVVAGLALAVTAGLHIKISAYLIHSYELFAPGKFLAPGDVATWGTARVAHSFALAFGVAAPFVIASLIYNVTLGAVNRAMPQLMVSFVGAPAVTAGGLILLAITAPYIISVWIVQMDAFMSNPGIVHK